MANEKGSSPQKKGSADADPNTKPDATETDAQATAKDAPKSAPTTTIVNVADVDVPKGMVLVLSSRPLKVRPDKVSPVHELRVGTQLVPVAVGESWFAKNAGVQILKRNAEDEAEAAAKS